jgi:hypothetical protein
MRLRNNSRQTKPRPRRPLQTSTNSYATQPLQTLRGYEAKPITPPQSAGLRGSYLPLENREEAWNTAAEKAGPRDFTIIEPQA